MEQRINVNEEKKSEVNEPTQQAPGVSCSNPAPQCMDKLREELSCTQWKILQCGHGSLNTIQLLFPQEVEARKAAGALNGRKVSVKVQRVELVVPEELQVLDLQWSLPVLEMRV
ncbi:hypothetical protein QQP08_014723 [Theobroma cacao]|nr:hypothetical protein QQP08_014723 [Theobroma cacao]